MKGNFSCDLKLCAHNPVNRDSPAGHKGPVDRLSGKGPKRKAQDSTASSSQREKRQKKIDWWGKKNPRGQFCSLSFTAYPPSKLFYAFSFLLKSPTLFLSNLADDLHACLETLIHGENRQAPPPSPYCHVHHLPPLLSYTQEKLPSRCKRRHDCGPNEDFLRDEKTRIVSGNQFPDSHGAPALPKWVMETFSLCNQPPCHTPLGASPIPGANHAYHHGAAFLIS